MTDATDSSGLHFTTDAEVRAAIGKYDAEVADGEIAFGPEGFADTVNGSAEPRLEADRYLAGFVAAHVREL
jgi:hypothetical protein